MVQSATVRNLLSDMQKITAVAVFEKRPFCGRAASLPVIMAPPVNFFLHRLPQAFLIQLVAPVAADQQGKLSADPVGQQGSEFGMDGDSPYAIGSGVTIHRTRMAKEKGGMLQRGIRKDVIQVLHCFVSFLFGTAREAEDYIALQPYAVLYRILHGKYVVDGAAPFAHPDKEAGAQRFNADLRNSEAAFKKNVQTCRLFLPEFGKEFDIHLGLGYPGEKFPAFTQRQGIVGKGKI